MQNAKDSFYEMLRGRLAALNPERAVLIRGVSRPALLTDENETQSTAALPECFHMRWQNTVISLDGALPRVTMRCDIAYETAGTGLNAGLDRGRMLAAMDAELLHALGAEPLNTSKVDYSALATGGTPQRMNTKIWWGVPEFGKVTINRDRIGRSLTVLVMSFAEQGEL